MGQLMRGASSTGRSPPADRERLCVPLILTSRPRHADRQTRPVTDDDLPVHEFASAAAFDSWLTDHHATSRGVWLRIARKEAAATTVTYPEAV